MSELNIGALFHIVALALDNLPDTDELKDHAIEALERLDEEMQARCRQDLIAFLRTADQQSLSSMASSIVASALEDK